MEGNKLICTQRSKKDGEKATIPITFVTFALQYDITFYHEFESYP